MSNSTTSEKPALRILDIHVSEVEKYPNTLRDIMFERNFEGMIIREVFSSETVEQVVSRLAEGAMNSLYLDAPSDGTTGIDFVPMGLYGRTLVSSQPDLKEYLDCAEAFRLSCSKLFKGDLDFEKRIETVLKGLSGGLSIQIPSSGEEEKSYTPATIRVLFKGNEMPVHAGNEVQRLPSHNHLNELLDTSFQFSYFLPITIPEGGGELVIYDLEWSPKARGSDKGDMYHLNEHVLGQHKSVTVAPRPGDMLVFDGGRYYHRVTSVLGERPRRTIGGFTAFSKQHDVLYYWS
jgi:hapalindole-type alkaloid chlorinase